VFIGFIYLQQLVVFVFVDLFILHHPRLSLTFLLKLIHYGWVQSVINSD
jgi:hypothetical protein